MRYCHPRTRFYHRYHVVWSTKYRQGFAGPMRDGIRDHHPDLRRTLGPYRERRFGAIISMFLSIPPSYPCLLSCSVLGAAHPLHPRVSRTVTLLGRRLGAWVFSTLSGNVTDDVINRLELQSSSDASGVSRWFALKCRFAFGYHFTDWSTRLRSIVPVVINTNTRATTTQ